jgi:Fe-S-cluster-containing dehydrogenase component
MNYGFVINNKTCIGCHACSTACKLPANLKTKFRSGFTEPG